MHERVVTLARGGPIAVRFFGVPFALVGLGTMGGGIYACVWEQAPWVVLAFLVPFGLIFASVGLGFTLGVSGVTIDADARTLKRWRGLVVPMWGRPEPLGTVRLVSVRCATYRRNKGGTYTVFPVDLHARDHDTDDSASTPLEDYREFDPARRAAERVARALHVAVRDDTQSPPLIRDADHLDEPLRQRIIRLGESTALPERPKDTAVRLEREGGTLLLHLPRSGMRAWLVMPIMTVAMFMAWTIMGDMVGGLMDGNVFQVLDTHDPFDALPLLFLVGMLLMIFLPFMRYMVLATRVTISREALDVEIRHLIGRTRVHIPCAQLEELDVSSRPRAEVSVGWLGSALVARSDQRSVAFGTGLKDAELLWMRAEIRRHIVGG